MTRDWLALEPGEEVRWADSPRLQTVLPWVAVGLVVAAVPLGLATTAVGTSLPVPVWPAAALGLVPPLLAFVWLRNVEFVVTTRRCYRKRGVLSRDVLAVGFETVQNSAYEQGILGSAFGYGTVTVDTAGAEGAELRFWRIDDPQSVQRLVLDRRDAFRDAHDGTGVPGSVEQWEAVLEEVRRLRRAAERYERATR